MFANPQLCQCRSDARAQSGHQDLDSENAGSSRHRASALTSQNAYHKSAGHRAPVSLNPLWGLVSYNRSRPHQGTGSSRLWIPSSSNPSQPQSWQSVSHRVLGQILVGVGQSFLVLLPPDPMLDDLVGRSIDILGSSGHVDGVPCSSVSSISPCSEDVSGTIASAA